jgi:heme/copper-type cytochrome/quinol oxidase subunit 2
MLTSLAVMSFNALFMQKMEVGLVSTVVFLSSIAVVCGFVLYDDNPWTLRFLKGVFTILTLMTISSVFILYVNKFSLLASVLIAYFLSALFLVFFLRKKNWTRNVMPQKVHESRRILTWLAVSLFGVILCFLFFILFNSRTIEPMNDVWSSIPVPTFLFLLFSCSIITASLALSKRGKYLPLLMILAISVLIEGIYYLVWYPSLYGDPFTTLGYARYVEKTGIIFDWNNLFSNRLWMDIIKGRGFPNFTAQLTRLLSLDIYWVHNIVLPLVWALIVPISLYEITCLLINEKPSSYPREALFSAFAGAMLVPVLIIWGANPTGNTLGFLFLFFSLPLTLRWVVQGGRLYWALAFVAVLASFMTHPMPGIFGIVFLYGATVFPKATSAIERVAGVSVSILGLPLVLVFAGSRFLPEGLVSVQSVLSFENAILTLPMLLSFAGLFLSLKFKRLNRQVLWLLVGFYVIVVVDFYISQYGLTDVAYGAERALVIAEFLFAPFIGLLISSLMRLFETRKSTAHRKDIASKSSIKRWVNLKTIVAVLLALLISLQSTVSVYQAFPRNEVGIAPTVYEMEAVYYISSTATRRFVVVSDTLFSNLAVGLLGIDWSYIGEYQRGAFGTSQWEFPLQQYFTRIVNQPSLEILDDAIEFSSAEEAYFVISIRDPNFNQTVEMMLEMLPVERIFGNGKLYVFKYPVPAFEGEGPQVRLVYDDGASTEEIRSRYFYVIKKDITYSIEVTGHSVYNASNYPQYWLFKNLTVNNVRQAFNNSSDINNFILLRGLNPLDTLRISWTADDEYSICGWKEDSFRNGWGPYPAYTYKLEPSITTENGILSLSADFKEGSPLETVDFYYSRSANVSTDDYPYITIKWRSFGKIAVSYVYFDDGTNQEILPFGSYNPFWSVTRVKLMPGKRISYVMVGLSNTKYMADIIGVQTIQIDYILICNSAS